MTPLQPGFNLAASESIKNAEAIGFFFTVYKMTFCYCKGTQYNNREKLSFKANFKPLWARVFIDGYEEKAFFFFILN